MLFWGMLEGDMGQEKFSVFYLFIFKMGEIIPFLDWWESANGYECKKEKK